MLSLACASVDDPSAFEQDLQPIELLFVVPDSSQIDVSPDSRIEFCWSGLLDPRSVRPGSANLSSGPLNFDTDLEVQLIPWRSPVLGFELAIESWCPGSVMSIIPKAPMQPGILYRVRLAAGLISGWAGEQLDTSTSGWAANERGEYFYIHEFKVDDQSPDEPDSKQEPPPQLSTLRQLFEAGQVFDPNSQRCSCHLDPISPASARLDLSSASSAFLDLGQQVMSTGFPMITPRRPSDSYFLQKLLRTDDAKPIHLVRGAPMPPNSWLSHIELASIAQWIADGAAL